MASGSKSWMTMQAQASQRAGTASAMRTEVDAEIGKMKKISSWQEPSFQREREKVGAVKELDGIDSIARRIQRLSQGNIMKASCMNKSWDAIMTWRSYGHFMGVALWDWRYSLNPRMIELSSFLVHSNVDSFPTVEHSDYVSHDTTSSLWPHS